MARRASAAPTGATSATWSSRSVGVDASGAHDDDRAEGGVAGHADEQLEAVSRT